MRALVPGVRLGGCPALTESALRARALGPVPDERADQVRGEGGFGAWIDSAAAP